LSGRFDHGVHRIAPSPLSPVIDSSNAIPMKNNVRRWTAAAIFCSFAWVGTAMAAKSDSCAHCHGTDGNSSSGLYPNLAGQTSEYLFRQIMAFKAGKRKNPMMSPTVGILSEQDARDLADYFSSQTMLRGSFKPDPVLVAKGKQVAEETQCAACHQVGFKGLNEIPRISRQKHTYIGKQLKDYRDGVRTNDDGVMAATTKTLTDEQIEALAQYLSSL
jgi:cytochrome c553